VRVRARAVYVVVGMLFISSIHYCVGACVQGIKPPTFAYPKEPHAQEAGIAVCSPPSNHVIHLILTASKKSLSHSLSLSLSLSLSPSLSPSRLERREQLGHSDFLTNIGRPGRGQSFIIMIVYTRTHTSILLNTDITRILKQLFLLTEHG
jgi:hypothetical protein